MPSRNFRQDHLIAQTAFRPGFAAFDTRVVTELTTEVVSNTRFLIDQSHVQIQPVVAEACAALNHDVGWPAWHLEDFCDPGFLYIGLMKSKRVLIYQFVAGE